MLLLPAWDKACDLALLLRMDLSFASKRNNAALAVDPNCPRLLNNKVNHTLFFDNRYSFFFFFGLLEELFGYTHPGLEV